MTPVVILLIGMISSRIEVCRDVRLACGFSMARDLVQRKRFLLGGFDIAKEIVSPSGVIISNSCIELEIDVLDVLRTHSHACVTSLSL